MIYYFNINKCFLCEYIAKYNLFQWSAAEFSASFLQSSVSRDPSEIWFAAQETFLIIINGENSFIQQGCIKLTKSDNKDINNATKIKI